MPPLDCCALLCTWGLSQCYRTGVRPRAAWANCCDRMSGFGARFCDRDDGGGPLASMGPASGSGHQGERQTVAALGHDCSITMGLTRARAARSRARWPIIPCVAGELAQALDTSAVNHVVDIGGASGTIIAALLRRTGVARHNPRTRGRGASRRSRAREARAGVALPGRRRRFLRERSGSRPLRLKTILHDWDDQQSVIIPATAPAHCGRMAVLFSSNGSCRSTETQARRRSPTSICSSFSRDVNGPRASLPGFSCRRFEARSDIRARLLFGADRSVISSVVQDL